MRLVEETPIDLAESEFQYPCRAADCQTPAQWVGWSSHAENKCPGGAYACTVHKEVVEHYWALVLSQPGWCDRCNTAITGQVSDHLRWIRL